MRSSPTCRRSRRCASSAARQSCAIRAPSGRSRNSPASSASPASSKARFNASAIGSASVPVSCTPAPDSTSGVNSTIGSSATCWSCSPSSPQPSPTASRCRSRHASARAWRKPPCRSGVGRLRSSYLRGRYFWNKRDPQSLQLALEAFQGAVKEDPTSARAWSGVADTVLLSGICVRPHASGRRDATWTRRRPQSARVDPDMPEAHAALGVVQLFFDWDRAAAEVSLRRALRFNPGYVYAHRAMAALLLTARKPREAIEQSREAVRLDPVSLAENYFLGPVLPGGRRYRRRRAHVSGELSSSSRGNGGCIEDWARVKRRAGEMDKGVEKYLEAPQERRLARVARALIERVQTWRHEGVPRDGGGTGGQELGWLALFCLRHRRQLCAGRHAKRHYCGCGAFDDAGAVSFRARRSGTLRFPYRSDAEFREIVGPAFSKR